MNAHRVTPLASHLMDGIDLAGVKTADAQSEQFALLLRRIVESMPAAKPVLTIDDFCKAHCITRPHYYELKRQGKGPREMSLGRRKLITQEAAAEWRMDREKDTLCGLDSPENSSR